MNNSNWEDWTTRSVWQKYLQVKIDRDRKIGIGYNNDGRELIINYFDGKFSEHIEIADGQIVSSGRRMYVFSKGTQKYDLSDPESNVPFVLLAYLQNIVGTIPDGTARAALEQLDETELEKIRPKVQISQPLVRKV